MDPPPSSRRCPSGCGGKGRGGSHLGLKMVSLPATSAPPGSTDSPPPPSTTSLPAPPLVPRQAVPSSSPAPDVLTSNMPPQPSQEFPWIYPPGGFLNLIQRPHYPQVQGENFHLVGQTRTFNQISPPPPPIAHGIETSQAKKQYTSANKTTTIDEDEDDKNDAIKPAKKRYWTPDEEERLASAWLNCSKDPIKGNDKRGDTFWKEITNDFNKKGNGKPTRETNQLKIHWSCLNALITDFNDAWTKATQMNTSGYSDDMLEEEAQKFYVNRFEKRFSLVHWWKILKEEPKWKAQFHETDKNNSEVVDILDDQPRPIGRDAAKAERHAKGKKENIMKGITILGDNVEKIFKMQQDRKVERENVTEAQIQLSNANLKAAKEQKEAKIFEVYNSLINQDTSHMSEDQKAIRDRAIRKLEEKLFAD